MEAGKVSESRDFFGTSRQNDGTVAQRGRRHPRRLGGPRSVDRLAQEWFAYQAALKVLRLTATAFRDHFCDI
jgi:hypothetical protein